MSPGKEGAGRLTSHYVLRMFFSVHSFFFSVSGYETVFMLNSAQHKISLAKKSQVLTIANALLLNKAKHEYVSDHKYEYSNN